MKIENRENLFINIVGLSLLCAGLFIKTKVRHSNLPSFGVYFCLFLFWLVMIWRRVVQHHIRKYLMIVASMEIFWISVRAIKFMTRISLAERYLWYLYYLPMLMIPAFCLLISIVMGKHEEQKPKKMASAFPVMAFLLFLMVLTNDFHSAVFIIPPTEGGMEVGNYRYGPGYFIIAVYILLCALACIGILIVKCRRPGRKLIRFLPFVPIIIAFLVAVAVISGEKYLLGFYRIDVTAVNCLCTTAALELCIQTSLIPTNSRYGELFRLSSIHALITDESFRPIIASSSYEEMDAGKMKEATKAPVLLGDGHRLLGAQIRHGYIFWHDDITEFEKLLLQLSEHNDYLQGKSYAIQQANEFRKKERRLIEKNRLYNRILTQTQPEIELYADLVEQIARESDPAREESLALQLAFVGAFIKRRDNLIFLCEEDQEIAPAELLYCVEESLSNLRLSGAACAVSLALQKPLSFEKISGLYENFYHIVYPLIGEIESICVYLIEEDEKEVISMRIALQEKAKSPIFTGGNVRATMQDGEWVVTVCA